MCMGYQMYNIRPIARLARSLARAPLEETPLEFLRVACNVSWKFHGTRAYPAPAAPYTVGEHRRYEIIKGVF